MQYAKNRATSISLMANSIGAYFALLAYKEENLKQCLFLSPVINMESLIQKMMQWFDISDEKLFKEQAIPTPIGQTLYWDYYQYVKNNPIVTWNAPTSILYGRKDNLFEYELMLSFATTFNCKLHLSENAEHYFHTDEDMRIYKNWITDNIV